MNLDSLDAARPFWSVVVPLYNKQDFVEDTLRSVLSQVAEHDFEVLVIDDGSVDQGPARVLAIGDQRVRLIRQANGGVSAARNRGIREARGQWLIFLDADDLLHPQALRAYETILRESPASEVLGGSYVRVPNGEVAAFKFAPHDPDAGCRLIKDLPSEILKAGMVFSASSIAIQRRLFDQMDSWFPEGESIGEDLDLWLRILERTELAFTPRCIALYRVDLSASLTANRIFNHLFPYLQRLEQRALRGEIPSRLVAPSLTLVADARVSMARESIRRGRRREVPALLIRAWRRVPSVRWWFTTAAFVFPVLLRWRER